MRKKLTPQLFLAITISFLLPLFFAYMSYYALTVANLPSIYPKFEDADLDCPLLLKKQKITASTDFSKDFWVQDNLIEHLSNFYFLGISPRVKTLVLRC